jgi:hypothetical protein
MLPAPPSILILSRLGSESLDRLLPMCLGSEAGVEGTLKWKAKYLLLL